jgi:hypothetical protein
MPQVLAAHLSHLPYDTRLVGPPAREEPLIIPRHVGLGYDAIRQLREQIPAVKALVPAAHPTAMRLVVVASSKVHREHALKRIPRCRVYRAGSVRQEEIAVARNGGPHDWRGVEGA